jgi:hypothetical protein
MAEDQREDRDRGQAAIHCRSSLSTQSLPESPTCSSHLLASTHSPTVSKIKGINAVATEAPPETQLQVTKKRLVCGSQDHNPSTH